MQDQQQGSAKGMMVQQQEGSLCALRFVTPLGKQQRSPLFSLLF